MKNAPELDLLVDLARLVRKYGPDTFDRLANMVSSPGATQRLAEVLREGARSSRTVSGQSRKLPLSGVMNDLQESDPDKHATLFQFYEALRKKELLPTLKEIRSFAVMHDLPDFDTVTHREKAISKLIEKFASKPLNWIKDKVAAASEHKRDAERGLGGWADIIMQTERKKPDPG